MSNKAFHRAIKLQNGEVLDIKYWAEDKLIFVAAFDENEIQVSVGTYSAEVKIAPSFNSDFEKSLIEGLASTLESDLLYNPELHLKNNEY